MDHVAYLDAKEKELDNLVAGTKSMIIRGAAGRKMRRATVVLPVPPIEPHTGLLSTSLLSRPSRNLD